MNNHIADKDEVSLGILQVLRIIAYCTVPPILLVLLVSVAFVALAEETLVRGIILYELNLLFKRTWLSILVSALIFSLVFHSTDGLILNMLYRVPFGIVTALMYKKTDTLAPAITFHWMYNVALSI